MLILEVKEKGWSIWKLLSLTLLVSLILVAVAGALQLLSIPNTANTGSSEVQMYWDSSTTNEVTLMDWGLLESYNNHSMVTYAKNTGTKDLTLFYTVSGLDSNLSIGWNWTNPTLTVGNVLPINWTLTTLQLQENLTYSWNLIIES